MAKSLISALRAFSSASSLERTSNMPPTAALVTNFSSAAESPAADWAPAAGWPAREALPSMNQMIGDQMGLAEPTETQQAMRERYLAQLADERIPPKE